MPSSTGELPLELSSFVGRRRELTAVKETLSASRLVTLTGIGGVGKTRLAFHAAADMRRGFRDGVCLVELGELRDGSLLVDVVAASDDTADAIAVYRLDPATRTLEPVAVGGGIATGIRPYGLCLYRSALTRRLAASSTSRSSLAPVPWAARARRRRPNNQPTCACGKAGRPSAN